MIASIRDKATVFRDREEAGRQLAAALVEESLSGAIVVLALPRGGVPVAYPVAAALNAPLEVLLVRKIGVPYHQELAVGAIASGGVSVLNQTLMDRLGLSEADLEPIYRREQAELERRDHDYSGGEPFPPIAGKTAILVDDGIATGATMEAAVEAVRMHGPASVIVAVPSAARDSVARIETKADRVIALSIPEPYIAVGAWFVDFPQVTDAEVVRLLGEASRRYREGA